MVEYSGWITVLDTAGEGDDESLLQVFAPIQERVEALAGQDRVLGSKIINARVIVWFGGLCNHFSSEVEEIIDLIHFVSRTAPGSYGLLYLWDDASDRDNEFCVWRLARGEVSVHSDTLLSPCVPVILDPVESE